MIHSFRLFDTNIVIDVNSGSVHVLDDIAFSVLPYIKNTDKDIIVGMLDRQFDHEDILRAISELEMLIEQGMLFSEASDAPSDTGNFDSLKSLCLNVTHDCNLRCRYCFASTGDFGTGRIRMSTQTGKAAIDFLIRRSGDRKNLEVDFFGGEPLMNFGTVREITRYALDESVRNGKSFRFTITTNAVGLKDEHINFINEYFDNAILSIDGRKPVNDKMRIFPDGSGSHDLIAGNIKKFIAARGEKSYYVRGTYTGENTDFSRDVMYLADMGCKNISVEPVVGVKDTSIEIKHSDIATLKKEYEALAMEYVKRFKEGNGFNFFHFMIDFEQGPCIYKRLRNCGAGYGYLAITPEGDIYPCHQFVGNRAFLMGNISKTAIDEKITSIFRDTNADTKEDCRNCWAKYYCSGGCAANAYTYNGSINDPYEIGCILQKKRIECALWVKSIIPDMTIK